MKRLSLIFLLFLSACASSPDLKEKARIQYRLGVTHLRGGDTTAALKELSMAVELDPESAIYYNALGLAFFYKDMLDKAEENFKKAIELNPELSDAHVNLGALYLREKRWDEAIKESQKALANIFYPTPEVAHNNIGWAYYNKGFFSTAVEHFKKAIEANPRYSLAYNNLGLTYLRLDKEAEAVKAFKKALSITPNYVEALYNLGLAYIKIKDREKAIESFEEVIRLSPESRFAQSAKEYMELLR